MKNKKALILAGGMGTRLRPLTFAVPKPLIPVRGRPIIDYIISALIKHGFNDLYVSLNYRADIIRLYLKEKAQKEYRISFFEETKPLGTAGPLALFGTNGIKLIARETILVINGDILTNLDFSNMFRQHEMAGSDLTVGMINFTYALSYGILDLDDENNVRGVREKPAFQHKASAGIYLVNRECQKLVPHKFFTMPDLIQAAGDNGLTVKGYLIKEHWLAIEQIKNLEEAGEAKKGDWISKL